MDQLSQYIQKNFSENEKHLFTKIKREYFYSSNTYGQAWKLIQQTITLLREKGINQGDKVVIWAPNMPEWPVLFFACILEGVVVVPANTLLSEKVVKKYIAQVKPKAVFSSIFQGEIKGKFALKMELEYLFDYLYQLVPTKPNRDIPEDELVEILYTSGTTGEPKGVMLTRKNFSAQLTALSKQIRIKPHSSLLSLLPYSHIYEQMVSLMFAIGVGAKIYYVSHLTPATVRSAMSEYSPTHLVLVPEVMKSLLDKIKYKVERLHLVWEFNFAVWVAGSLPKPIRRFLFYPVLKQFGGRIEMATLGGAKTDKEVQKIFHAFGIDVIEGYGLTETMGPVTMNKPGQNFIGTSGKVIDGVDIKLSGEGEVLIKGDVVFPGYFERPELNKEVFTEEGYLKTGDIAEFDENDCLVLKGRQKFRIALSNGEKVYPEDIEFKLNETAGIKESCVFALDLGRGVEVSAAVVLDKNAGTLDDLMQKANENLEIPQHVQNYIEWPEDKLPRTSTLKLQRKEISERSQRLLAGKSEGANIGSNNNQTALHKIISMVCTIPQEHVRNSMVLSKDLKVDSLKRLTILTLVEEEFEVNVDEQQITTKTTVSDLQKLIDRSPKLEKRSEKLGYQFSPIVRFFRHFVGTYLTLPALNLAATINIVGEENIKGQAIYISNHPGVYDLFFLINALGRHGQKYAVLADIEHWEWPRWPIHQPIFEILGGAIAVDPEGKKDVEKTLHRVGRLVNSGYSIALAPQGRYTFNEKDTRDIQDGTAYMAKSLDLQIVPSYIDQEFGEKFDPRKKWRYIPRSMLGGNFTVKIGEPFTIPSYVSDEEANKMIAGKILELKDK